MPERMPVIHYVPNSFARNGRLNLEKKLVPLLHLCRDRP
jgi:hypothetical protein